MPLPRRLSAHLAALGALLAAVSVGASCERRSAPDEANTPDAAPPPTAAAFPSLPAPPPSGDAPEETEPAPANPNLAARIDGRLAPLPFARARFDGDFLWIDLSAAPIACAASTPERMDVLSFPLPLGPAGDFYRGEPIDLDADLKTQNRASGQPRLTLTVHRAEPIPNAWIEASIAITDRSPGPEGYLVHAITLDGMIRARVCPQIIPAARPLPTGEPAPFEYARAFATLAVDPATGEQSIAEITFTTDPGARCGEQGNPSFSLTNLSGARSSRRALGKPQPAVPSYFEREPGDTCPGSAVAIPGGPRAWVTFDELSFVPGGSIRGSVDHAALVPIRKGSRAPGRFVATVCRAP